MIPYLRSLTVLAAAAASSFLFTGCLAPEGEVAYSSGGYYGADYGPDYGDAVDVYYVGGRPYSHYYGGPLIVRDGGYYYSHGGGYARYDRNYVRAHYHGSGSHTVVRDDRHAYRNNVNNVNVRTERNYRTQNNVVRGPGQGRPNYTPQGRQQVHGPVRPQPTVAHGTPKKGDGKKPQRP